MFWGGREEKIYLYLLLKLYSKRILQKNKQTNLHLQILFFWKFLSFINQWMNEWIFSPINCDTNHSFFLQDSFIKCPRILMKLCYTIEKEILIRRKCSNFVISNKWRVFFLILKEISLLISEKGSYISRELPKFRI